MKNSLFLILLFLSSCAHHKADHSTSPSSESTGSVSDISKESGKTRAIFHVITPLNIQLIVYNLGTKKEEIILMDKTLSQISLNPGFWRITGFLLGDHRFLLLNSSKQFVFRLKKNQFTYAGSFIFQCPRVNQRHLEELKKMSFFNRYPFASKKSLCEMVVGSDYENVNRVWLKLVNSKQPPIKLGF